MIDERLRAHFGDAENGLDGLMEAVARAQKLGQAAWKEKEASERTAEALSWTKSVDDAVAGIRDIDENISELTGKASGNLRSQAEAVELAVREAVEQSMKSLREGLDDIGGKSESARKAAETAGQLARVASDAVEVSNRVSREALKTSLEASREAIERATEISRKARGATLASSNAAADIRETSVNAVREAADTSIKAFRTLIANMEESGRKTCEDIEASFLNFEKSLGLPEESLTVPAPQEVQAAAASEESSAEQAAAPEKAEEQNPPRNTHEFRDTEARLKFLISMFNKDQDS